MTVAADEFSASAAVSTFFQFAGGVYLLGDIVHRVTVAGVLTMLVA